MTKTYEGGPERACSGFYLALVHYPVLNRLGETISSTVDSFDFFDASRLALTFGIDQMYIVHPKAAQQALVARLIEHGQKQGREQAERGYFDHSQGVQDLQVAVDDVTRRCGRAPKIIATTAKPGVDRVSVRALREELSPESPQLWLIGKAWGMTQALIEGADAVVESIDGRTGYNHLSVRSALSIYVDRMLGGE